MMYQPHYTTKVVVILITLLFPILVFNVHCHTVVPKYRLPKLYYKTLTKTEYKKYVQQLDTK